MSELYHFRTTGTPQRDWYYHDGGGIVSFGGNNYTPVPLRRARWNKTIKDHEIRIIMADTVPPADQFIDFNPTTVLWVDVRSMAGNLLFTGKVVNAKYSLAKRSVELRTSAVSALLASDVPARRFGPTCQVALYDQFCTIDPALFDQDAPTAAIVVSGDGLKLTHANFALQADPFWANGRCVTGDESSYITDHTGSTITILVPFRDFSNVTTTVFAGCAKTLRFDVPTLTWVGDCIDKFSNEQNFRGTPTVPCRNPVTETF